MAEENTQKKTAYHLYAQLSKTYFSYKKPGDDKAYALMYAQYHNNMLTLHFRKAITSENVVELNCYLPDAKVFEVSNLFEGMMARRRVAFENGQNYDSDEVIKCPITSFNREEGKDVAAGLLVIDTEMYDGIPRVRISYTDNAKNDTVEIVFNSRIPSGAVEAKAKAAGIDFADIAAFELANTLKELQNPMIPIMYRFTDAAVNSITRYISACFGNRNNNYSGNSNNYASQPSGNSNVPDEYDPF